jgi:hypothetical protein
MTTPTPEFRQLTQLTPAEIADEAIGQYLENIEQHGLDPATARSEAVREIEEGAAVTAADLTLDPVLHAEDSARLEPRHGVPDWPAPDPNSDEAVALSATLVGSKGAASRAVREMFAAPTDSESADAPHNPDIWDLRSRVTALLAALDARDAEDAQRGEQEGR